VHSFLRNSTFVLNTKLSELTICHMHTFAHPQIYVKKSDATNK